MPLHRSQVSNRLFYPLRSLTRFNRLDIIPQLIELPDRLSAGNPAGWFLISSLKNVHDTAKLLAITMRCDNFPFRFR